MATLAAMLKSRGFDVHGSDANVYPPMDRFLAEQGIMPLLGYDAVHITDQIDLVVIGNAVSRGNPEVEAVLEQGIRYMSLPEIVREFFLWGRCPIVVAGTHGKTTTTAMVAWSLVESNTDPSFLVGGIPINFSTSFRLGEGRLFVVEGDEYDSAYFDKSAKLLKYLPHVAVVGNLEFDHADIYRDLDDLRSVFRRFVSLVPRNGCVLLGADDAEACALADAAHCQVETFGLETGADWRAVRINYQRDRTRFEVEHRGQIVTAVEFELLGAFNVRNAIASIAAAAAVGTVPAVSAKALSGFRGVSRRLELRGVVGGVAVYDDFAHHPTAVCETLTALREVVGVGHLKVVFEPRSATACRRVFQGKFAEALSVADDVVVAPVYRSMLPELERLSVAQLVSDLRSSGTSAYQAERLVDIGEMIVNNAVEGDVVVLMSNGDLSGLSNQVLDGLRAFR